MSCTGVRRAVKVLYGILAALALLVAALFLVPPFLDWERLKPGIAERVEAATGRRLWIDGEIAVSLLPAPTLTLANLRLANLPGARAPAMARIESIDLALALGPLFGGEIAVTSLELVAPVVELERLADGRPNWLFEGAADAMDAASGRAVRLDSIAVTDGAVVYREGGGPPTRIERIDAVFSARALDGPFRGEGAFSVEGAAVGFRLATGAVGADGAMPATAELALAGEAGSLSLEGTVRGLDGAPEFAGAMRAMAPDLGTFLAALPVALEGVPAAALPDGAFSARGAIAARAGAVSADDLQLRLGESQASGAVSWRGGATPALAIAMALNRLDLDGFPPADPAPAAATASPPAAPRAAALFRALPAGLAASVDLAIETVTYRGNVMRQARAILALDEGAVTVRQASALLPGGADVTLAGRIADGADGPSFAGVVDMAADDLRAVLAWLGLDVAAVPADRLRRLAASADLHAQGARIAASKMDVRIDATRIEGAAAVQFGDRPRLSLALAADAVNADAYLPAASAKTEAGAETEAGGWPALDGVEAELALEVGALTYGGARLLGLALDAVLRDGQVTLRRAAVADAAGLRLALTGTARPRGMETAVDLSFEGGARSLSGLVALLAIESGFRPEALGPVSLRGTLAGDAQALAVDVAVAARAAEASLAGTIAALPDRAAANLALRLHAPDAAELARIAGAAPGAAPARLGALTIEAGIGGGPEEAVVILGAEAAGATLQVAGSVKTPFETPRYRATADLRHPRAAALAETVFGAAAGIGPGGLHLTGAVAGDEGGIAVSDIAGAVGDTRATGAVSVRLDGERPSISATVGVDALDLAAAAFGAARSSAGAEDAGRRADAPLDLSFLDGLDATLALEAGALRLGCCRIEQAALDLAAADGALAVRSLGGRLFGGVLEAEGGLTGGPAPAADMRFRLSDFDMGAALRAAGVDALAGRATVEGHLSARGATPRALLEGLAGEAVVTARGGSVQGVDLAALARGLEAGDDGFAAAAERALSSGATALRSLDGRVSVRDGRAVVDGLALGADAGVGAVRGTVDLPAWRVDLAALFRLAGHPEAPPLGLVLRGPIERPARGYVIEEMQAYLAERRRPPPPPPRDPDAELRDFVDDLLRTLER